MSSTGINHCGSCGWHIQPDKCGLLKIFVNPSIDHCSHHRRNIPTCDICGNRINKGGIFDLNNEKPHLVCENCYSAFGTCRLCDYLNVCSFETDPSSIPKIIQQKIQRGPYQTVQTVRNPERVRITCENGCKCYSKENGCLKQNIQTCGNNKYTY